MIIAITNQKGGVGKTTSVMNIGAFLAVKGNKVLLVDIDPQSNLTSGLGIDTKEDGVKSVYDFLINKVPLNTLIRESRIQNLFVLPSTIELAGAEIELVNALSRENILKRGLENIKNDYDFILIDCPPSLGLLTINGLVASEQVIIPVQAEYFALEGLGQLVNTIKLVKNSLNPSMDIGGVVLTMFDSRTNLSKDVNTEINNFFNNKVFSSIIPRSIKLSEAPSRGLTIYEYAPLSPGALAYDSLANEIIERFGNTRTLVRPMLQKKLD